MEKVILIIILQCSLAGLKYYFQLFYKAYKKIEEENKYSEPDETTSSVKTHHLIKSKNNIFLPDCC